MGGRVGRRVDVGAEHERGEPLGSGGGVQDARDVGVLVRRHVPAPDGGEVVREHARHVVLAGRRGRDPVVAGVGRRVNLDVAHEALEDV